MEDSHESLKVASQIFGKDDYVIQIDDTSMEIEVP